MGYFDKAKEIVKKWKNKPKWKQDISLVGVDVDKKRKYSKPRLIKKECNNCKNKSVITATIEEFRKEPPFYHLCVSCFTNHFSIKEMDYKDGRCSICNDIHIFNSHVIDYSPKTDLPHSYICLNCLEKEYPNLLIIFP